MELDQFVCEKYKVKNKKISDKKLFKILEILIKQFYEIKLADAEVWNCDYDIYAQIGEEDKNSGDEECPDNIGTGWGLREAILSAIVSDRVLYDEFAYDEIRWGLMSSPERLIDIIKG